MTEADLTPLLQPRDGVPRPVATADGLAEACARLAAAEGPVAVDTERASGFRYSQRAYLVQLRRLGAGTVLVDAGELSDLTSVADAIADAEWVIHAASQDLPALFLAGMRPRRIFDTELAGRLLGMERVGLGAMAAALLGVHLEKGHGAADWSRRPLPEEWLTYAALDVELLVDLRDALAAQLTAQGKSGWAEQEFAATLLAAGQPAAPRPDPWRRTSGVGRVRGGRGLAVVRSLWTARDELARELDVAPGRVLPDAAIVAAAQALPGDLQALCVIPPYGARGQRSRRTRWWNALREAYGLPEAALPPAVAHGAPGQPPSSAGRWARTNPEAAERLAACREAVGAVAASVGVPVENVVGPAVVRALAWEPPAAPDVAAVAAALREGGARPWQVELTAAALAQALHRP